MALPNRYESLVEGSEVSIIKENKFVYEETVKKKKKSQSSDKVKDKEKEDDKVNLFFREDGLYKGAYGYILGSHDPFRSLFYLIAVVVIISVH
ncbi:hypothetical protein Tco_0849667 [Tanacetum coccineum]